ncbi:16S rRNA (cytidine(1402)-2'-O)-methyltransferase [Wohlfahrtiimonas larvae]|uniref:Ribosomal RNA small subunit methyltransferase I n=1 Tax=Wohlfahrtiimonas larvae TaxID=1157986 RepID=A0ABP9MI77_9GAMM|nr:16S rRNA (cytidine(1402)-2'-O)-methyltransferase [Wohlfahrtiimonas larvae]
MSTCYVVATPIGNIEDWSSRAIETLKTVDLIFAEDTRHSAKLMQLFNITTPMRSLHDHNETDRIDEILSLLNNNQSIAIISDAGTPLISDPGFKVVRALREHEQKVIPIPGVSALITALSVSGIATDRFSFEGFLPAKSSGRKSKMEILKKDPRTLIFYESSHRIIEMLKDAISIFGETRYAFIGREMTKHYESYLSNTLEELLAHYQEHIDEQRGEYVVVIEGANIDSETSDTIDLNELLVILLAELPLKQAVNIATKITKLSKNHIYQTALTIQNNV